MRAFIFARAGGSGDAGCAQRFQVAKNLILTLDVVGIQHERDFDMPCHRILEKAGNVGRAEVVDANRNRLLCRVQQPLGDGERRIGRSEGRDLAANGKGRHFHILVGWFQNAVPRHHLQRGFKGPRRGRA